MELMIHRSDECNSDEISESGNNFISRVVRKRPSEFLYLFHNYQIYVLFYSYFGEIPAL